MTTYSVGTTAISPQISGTVSNYILPDTSLNGTSAAIAKGMATVMSQGDVMLAKDPSGLVGYYSFDPERSTPANPVIIKRYG